MDEMEKKPKKFNISKTREITAANFNTYVVEALHPDRVMKEHDLIYMLEGSWEIWEEEESFLMKPGDVLILYAGLHHYGKIPCEKSTRTMYIHVDSKDDLCCGDDQKREIRNLPSLISTGKNKKIEQYFRDCVVAYNNGKDADKIKAEHLCSILLCELSDCTEKTCAGADMINEALQYLYAEPERFITAKEMAKRLYVCPRTLNNKFMERFNKTYYRYQMDQKLENVAAFLVQFPEAKLYEAAKNFGFYDEFHLSRSFSKRYKISPGKYKE